MSWPLSQDYNEAIQSPSSSFSDPELKQGEATTNDLGLPMPCSGNFADVYAVTTPQRKFAVKCFTRQIPGLRERYKEISSYLKQTPLPFMVDFSYLEQGIRVRGEWYPILKMQWVEGFALNDFVKKKIDKPQVLDVLSQLWVKLSARLREANMAHCDLQHGNVLLVPGSKEGSLAVKLVDYDGMCVPALTMLKSIEVGHPSFQHPQRAKEGIYSLEVDRFSHLVIYTALRALMGGGKSLWDKYDNGDNLLFKQADFVDPGKSPLFAELLASRDPLVCKLTEALVSSLAKPLDRAPLLEDLTPKPAKTAVQESTAQPQRSVEEVFASATAPPAHRRSEARRKSKVPVVIGLAVAVVVAVIGGGFLFMSGNADKVKDTSKVTTTPRDHAALTQTTPDPSKTLLPKPKTDTKAESKPKTETKAEPAPKVGPDPEPKAPPKPDAKTESKPVPEPKPQPTPEPKPEQDKPMPANRLAALAGLWDITYANGFKRTYVVGAEGLVVFVEERRGALPSSEKDILLDFGDGKLERVRVENGDIKIEHFRPAANYPQTPNLLGTAARKPLTPTFTKFKGAWEVTLSNGMKRQYMIDASGAVVFLAEHRGVMLVEKGGDVLLDFGDGSVEVLARMENELHVKHFSPAANYPQTALWTGIGRLLPNRQTPDPEDGFVRLTGKTAMTNSIGMKLTYIPAGEFMMGSPDTEDCFVVPSASLTSTVSCGNSYHSIRWSTHGLAWGR